MGREMILLVILAPEDEVESIVGKAVYKGGMLIAKAGVDKTAIEIAGRMYDEPETV